MPSKSVALHLFILIFSAYILTGAESYRFHSDASYLRYEVTKSIIEKSDVSIPDGWGVKGKDGRDYSWLALGSALLATPLYVLGELSGVQPQILVSFVNPLFAAATGALLFLFAQSLRYSTRASILVSLFYGLGTMAWPASKQAFDHPIETFFLLLSVYFLHLYKDCKTTRHILIAGGSAGLAFLVRPTTALLLPALFVLLAILHFRISQFTDGIKHLTRDVFLLLVGFSPFAAISLWYNHYRFGSIFETGYSLIAAKTGLDFFTGTSLITGLGGFLFSPGKGFFFYSPIAILFFFSIGSFFRRHPEIAACFICLIVSYLVVLSRNIYWHGDWAWGPRYLLALTPALVLPITQLLDSRWWSGRAFRLFAYALFCMSFTIQLVAVSVDPLKYFYHLIEEEKVVFTSASGEGVQPMMEPPTEVYFDWGKSPIPAQFRFAREIVFRAEPYTPVIVAKSATMAEKLKMSPELNLFDFWWVYMYRIDGISSVFIVVLAFLCLMAHAGRMLFKAYK